MLTVEDFVKNGGDEASYSAYKEWFKEEENRIELVEKKEKLNKKRDQELKNLTINNISCTESNLFKMAVKYNVLPDGETLRWIDIDNNIVELTKDELGQLIGRGAGAVEEIYLRYRRLKDEA